MQIEALAVEMPALARRHPNRVPFTGVLTRVDDASERAPAGARGHRVLLTRAAAEAALPSLIGMALDYTPALDGHDARRKVGIITAADIVGNEIIVSGHLFARDFPELVSEMRGRKLGMSYEVADARVEDVRANVWKLVEVTFTGAAVLIREKAAYDGTSIEVAATTTYKISGAKKMNEEQTQQLITTTERLAAAAEALTQTVTRIDAQHEQVQSTIARIVAAMETETEMQARLAELEQQNTELRAQIAKEIAAAGKKPVMSARKTLSPLVTSILAKNGIEMNEELDQAAVDASLASLPIEQRIAVKSQMARAGILASAK
jgi:hypothetical protein